MGLFGKKHHAATSSPPPLRFNSLQYAHSTFRGRKARGQASGAKKDKREDKLKSMSTTAVRTISWIRRPVCV